MTVATVADVAKANATGTAVIPSEARNPEKEAAHPR
jgi:hypothetical protein